MEFIVASIGTFAGIAVGETGANSVDRLNLDGLSRVSGIKRNTLISVGQCEKRVMSLASAPWCAYASSA
jgi:hypothetical protein